MESFWKSLRGAWVKRDLPGAAVPALPAATHPSSFPVPKVPSSRILRRVCLLVQSILFERKADVIRPMCSSKKKNPKKSPKSPETGSVRQEYYSGDARYRSSSAS